MQIAGIAQQLLAPLSFDRPSSTSAAGGGANGVIDSSSGDLVSGGVGRAFHEILARYDVKSITPEQFGDMVNELHDAGEINDDEFRELNKMRLQLDQSGIPSDEPVNLVSFFEKKADAAEKDCQTPGDAAKKKADQAALTEAKRQLDWSRKFALVQASGGDGIDLGA
jgi:hypothetical protein